jgi:RNA-binding protein YlmH
MSIYQHFRPEEQPFIDQILEWRKMVLDQYTIKLTDFVDPREQYIIESLIGSNDEIRYAFWEGYDGFERTRCVLYPSFFELNREDFRVRCFQLDYPDKFVTIKHPDVLGALMNLGLKREKFGDILIDGGTVQLVLADEISDFVKMNLTAVGKAKVELMTIDSTRLQSEGDDWQEQSGTVSSLRLDAVLAEAFHLSRSKVVPYIKGKKVKLNWKLIEQTSLELQKGDTISMGRQRKRNGASH